MAAHYDGGNWVDWAQTTCCVVWGHWHVFFLLNLFFILIYIYYRSIYEFTMPWLHVTMEVTGLRTADKGDLALQQGDVTTRPPTHARLWHNGASLLICPW
jgi:hypothetical protein